VKNGSGFAAESRQSWLAAHFRLRDIALRPGTGKSVGQALLDGPAGAAAPELIERTLDSGEEVQGIIRRADLLRLPVATERLADDLEGCGAGPLADLLGEELRKLRGGGADVDRVALALDEADTIDAGGGHGIDLFLSGSWGEGGRGAPLRFARLTAPTPASTSHLLG